MNMTNNLRLYGNAVLLVLSIFIISCTSNKRNEDLGTVDAVKYPIQYKLTDEHWQEDRELIAVINSKEYKLISYDESACIDTVKVADFNNNGYSDVLVEYITGCGANCCANNYQIFSFDGQEFNATERVGYDWDGVEIVESSTGISFVVETSNEGYGRTELCEDLIETYRLNDYDLELISVIRDQKKPAIAELKAADFIGRESDTLYLSFDLDGDSIDDKIFSSYWQNWGRIVVWNIEFGNGLTYVGEASTKRIGILNTKTNKVNDLVIECNEILKWNGYRYE